MDPVNILLLFNLIAVFGANVTGAKKGFKATISEFKDKPKSWLQQVPLTIAAFATLASILGAFQVGTLSYTQEHLSLRITALVIYISFSWLQVWAFKTLGNNYAQELVIFKNHKLVSKGLYRFFRHPQYICQVMLDLAAAAALFSYILLPLAVLEIPLLILRASLENKLLERNFKTDYPAYKKQTLF